MRAFVLGWSSWIGRACWWRGHYWLVAQVAGGRIGRRCLRCAREEITLAAP